MQDGHRLCGELTKLTLSEEIQITVAGDKSEEAITSPEEYIEIEGICSICDRKATRCNPYRCKDHKATHLRMRGIPSGRGKCEVCGGATTHKATLCKYHKPQVKVPPVVRAAATATRKAIEPCKYCPRKALDNLGICSYHTIRFPKGVCVHCGKNVYMKSWEKHCTDPSVPIACYIHRELSLPPEEF